MSEDCQTAFNCTAAQDDVPNKDELPNACGENSVCVKENGITQCACADGFEEQADGTCVKPGMDSRVNDI